MSLPNAEEIRLAQQIQQSFAPRKERILAHNLQYAARSISVHTLNGDYYDFIPVGPGRIGLLIADISGKGLPAALLVASLRAFIISQERSMFNDMRDLARKANELLYQSTPAHVFASLFLGLYEERERRLTYVNCGQVPPLLLEADGLVHKLGTTAPVIGILEDWYASAHEVELHPGDTLVMLTDGITEAMNRTGQQFGYDRLIGVANSCSGMKPADMADTLIKAVNNFSGFNQQDDLTVVVARVHPEV
jgi:serine phosphatase RsbU (regulator of sigma subunit)